MGRAEQHDCNRNRRPLLSTQQAEARMTIELVKADIMVLVLESLVSLIRRAKA